MLGGDVRARVAEVFRLEYARLVASVLRIVRDVDAAEEIAQAAFEQAVARWPADGLPERSGACAARGGPRHAATRSPTRRSWARWTAALSRWTPTRFPTTGSG